jgi:hypothetical protein
MTLGDFWFSLNSAPLSTMALFKIAQAINVRKSQSCQIGRRHLE